MCRRTSLPPATAGGPSRDRAAADATLASALPDATAQQVALALQLVLGVLVHMLSVHAPGPEAPSASLPQLFRQLVVFSAAGIEALCREAPAPTAATNAPDRGGS